MYVRLLDKIGQCAHCIHCSYTCFYVNYLEQVFGVTLTLYEFLSASSF